MSAMRKMGVYLGLLEDAEGEYAETASVVRAQAAEATWISAGMSADLEQAIRHGATHLRIGSAVLGTRPVVK